ncbi:type IX secretion system membrane protein, PorP/SprF family [Belliella buryatensis]|uniref:Type IX secretion system membrane protein, PorP/SprF family n=1 Tax=Belliella buryatensis TaxID=1500549 RepID=A0A239H205_9BACT|nr:type IX secretion system membrane protein PorP/SprF [Belliella buryatensis]SNS75211.1 type IX secretion system membrane protein, PorP/SprF family [Belliella buryatensis]
MKKKYIIGMLMGLLMLSVLPGEAQQLPQFSQYIFNGLHINPAYAGYKNEGYIQTTYRSQWVNFPGAPRTMSLTADLSANEGRMGFGVSYVRDRIGLTESNLAMLTYAYRINTGDRGRLSLGISGGISEYAFDPSDIITVNPDDPTLPVSRVAATAPNMNTGVFYHTDRFYAGISAFNMIGRQALLREDIAVAFHDFHYYLTFGGMVDLSDNVQLKPSVLVKHVKGSPTSYDLNAMFLLMDRVWLGGSYRSNVRVFEDQLQENLSKRNAVALVMEYFITPGLRLGYAYDYNLNALNSFRNESHEISLGVYLRSKREIVNNPRWF